MAKGKHKPCPTHDWKPGGEASRFCKKATKRMEQIQKNLANATATLERMRKIKHKLQPKQWTGYLETFTTWNKAAHAAPKMYCSICRIGCKKES